MLKPMRKPKPKPKHELGSFGEKWVDDGMYLNLLFPERELPCSSNIGKGEWAWAAIGLKVWSGDDFVVCVWDFEIAGWRKIGGCQTIKEAKELALANVLLGG